MTIHCKLGDYTPKGPPKKRNRPNKKLPTAVENNSSSEEAEDDLSKEQKKVTMLLSQISKEKASGVIMHSKFDHADRRPAFLSAVMFYMYFSNS